MGKRDAAAGASALIEHITTSAGTVDTGTIIFRNSPHLGIVPKHEKGGPTDIPNQKLLVQEGGAGVQISVGREVAGVDAGDALVEAVVRGSGAEAGIEHDDRLIPALHLLDSPGKIPQARVELESLFDRIQVATTPWHEAAESDRVGAEGESKLPIGRGFIEVFLAEHHRHVGLDAGVF